MKSIKRRTFLTQTSGIAAMAIAHPVFTRQKALAANDRIHIGLLGCGGRGQYVARGMVELGAQLTYLCDLHNERLDAAEQFISSVQKEKPKRLKDMKELFAAPDLDAVIIATPDHWHALATVLAARAGKDVYVEKPHAHNIWESLQMIKAAQETGQLVQVGTQNRSAPYNLAALDYIKTGKLGEIGLVKVYNLQPGDPFYLGQPGTSPKDFDWDAWLGPAPSRPYHEQIFDGGWHKFWDFSAGDIVDDGIHQLDLALMLMGDPDLPMSASCTGGRYIHKDDDAEIPDVQIATYEYKDYVLTFEFSFYPRFMRETTGTIRRNDELPYWTQNSTRIELYGRELMMTIGRHGGGWQVTTSGGRVVEQMYGRPPDYPHYTNFLECVRERKRPAASIELAHPANAMIHMANIAHRIGNTTVKYNPQKNEFTDNSDANQLIKRQYRQGYEFTA